MGSVQSLTSVPRLEPNVPASSQISMVLSSPLATMAWAEHRLFLALHFERMSIPGGFSGIYGMTPGLCEQRKGVEMN